MRQSDLEAERDFLLRSLRDLDEERAAGDLSEADYHDLRDRYTVQAAAVLGRLQGQPEAASTLGARKRGTGRVRAGVVVGVVAVAVAAGAVVASTAGERLPGDQATGEIAEGTTGKLARARQLIGAGKVSEAVKVYDEVLKQDPEHPEALAYRGWIVHLAGLSDRGLEYVDRAVAAEPSYADAHFFRGMILWRARGDAASAVTEFKLFLESDPPPEMVELVRANLARAEAEVAAGNSPTTAP